MPQTKRDVVNVSHHQGQEVDTRARIIESAWQHISKTGVRQLRVPEVAKSAQVSVGLVYYHFGSRNGLIKATMQHSHQLTATAYPSGMDSRNGLEMTKSILLADFDNKTESVDNAVVWHEILSAALFDNELSEQVRNTVEEWRNLIADNIRAGQRDLSIQETIDPSMASKILTALADGLLGYVVSKARSLEDAKETLLKAIGTLLDP